MREHSEQLAAILQGSFELSYVATVQRGDDVLVEQPVIVSGLGWDAGASVESSADVEFVRADPSGEPLAPRQIGDLLSPFGSEVTLSARVSAGPFVEFMQLGVFRIVSVPKVRRDVRRFLGEWVTVSEAVEVDVEDRMSAVIADRFTKAQTVKNRSSVWAELDSLTPFPTARSVADRTVPRSIVYEEDRDEAVQTLAAALGGVAHFNTEGALTVRTTSTVPVARLTTGDGGYALYGQLVHGRLVEASSEMTAERVYNGVRVTGKRGDDEGTEFSREAWVTGGPLDPNGPFGRKPYFYHSDFITTNTQADAEARRLLTQVSTLRGRTVAASCVIDPRIEVGDVVTIEDRDLTETIRLSKIQYGNGVMSVEGAVL